MRLLKKNGKYDLQKLKKDALGSLTAVGWIFPLALAFGSNSPFGAAAGLAFPAGTNTRSIISALSGPLILIIATPPRP